jgi:hypothetical protein
MKKALLAISVAAALCLTMAAQTAGAADFGGTLSVGTTGFGAHLSTELMPNLNGRVGINALNYSYSGSTSNADYDFKLKLNTFDALLDYYPTSTAFRLTAGVIGNNNKVSLSAKPNASGSYTFQGNTYTSATAGQVNGNVDFRKVAPYLGIGYGNAVKDTGFSFSGDLGVAFSGNPRSSLTSSNCTASAGVCTQLASDVASENANVQDKLNNLRYFPVVRIGVSYKF